MGVFRKCGDRRKFGLVCTEKATPLIEQGRALQHSFADALSQGLGPEDLVHFRRCVAVFDHNIDALRASARGGESEETT